MCRLNNIFHCVWLSVFFIALLTTACQVADTTLVSDEDSLVVERSIFDYSNHKKDGTIYETAIKKADRFFKPHGFEEGVVGNLINVGYFGEGVISFEVKFDSSTPKFQTLYFSVEGAFEYVIFFENHTLYLYRKDHRGAFAFRLDRAVVDNDLHTYKIVKRKNNSLGETVELFQDGNLLRKDDVRSPFNPFYSPYFGADPRPGQHNREIIGYYTLIDWNILSYEDFEEDFESISYFTDGNFTIQQDDIFFRREGALDSTKVRLKGDKLRKGALDSTKVRLKGDKLREGRIEFTVKFDSSNPEVQTLYLSTSADQEYFVFVFEAELYLIWKTTGIFKLKNLDKAVVDDNFHSYRIELRPSTAEQDAVVIYQDDKMLRYDYVPRDYNPFISPFFGYAGEKTFLGSKPDMVGGEFRSISWLPITSVDAGNYLGSTFISKSDYDNYEDFKNIVFRFTNLLPGSRVTITAIKEDRSSLFLGNFALNRSQSVLNAPEGSILATLTFTPEVVDFLGDYSGRILFDMELSNKFYLYPEKFKQRLYSLVEYDIFN